MGGGREVQGGGSSVYLWLIHVDVWQKPIQHCKAIIVQLKINLEKIKTLYEGKNNDIHMTCPYTQNVVQNYNASWTSESQYVNPGLRLSPWNMHCLYIFILIQIEGFLLVPRTPSHLLSVIAPRHFRDRLVPIEPCCFKNISDYTFSSYRNALSQRTT